MFKLFAKCKVWMGICVLVLGFGGSIVSAQTNWVWTGGGGDNDWSNGANWNPSGVPNIDNGQAGSILISNGIVNIPGQIAATSSGTLTINNGSVVVTGSSNILVGWGSSPGYLNINAATLSLPSGQLQINAGIVSITNGSVVNGASITMSALANLTIQNSSATFQSGLSINGGTLTLLSGGSLALSGEFSPVGTTILNGGSLTVGQISLVNGAGSVTIQAGTLTVTNAPWGNSSFYGTPGGYIDFALGSTGSIVLSSEDLATVRSQIASGIITLNGVTSDLSNFTLQTSGTGVQVSLTSLSIPEPSVLALLAVGGMTLLGTVYKKYRKE